MANHQARHLQTVSQLGEQGILDAMLPFLKSDQAGLGPGDDAGALTVGTGEVVVSVDTIVENQDFKLEWPSGYQHRAFDIGWKSIAQNVSDINAMGGVPTGAVISLSLPPSTTAEWVSQFAQGITAAIDALGASRLAILGGDLGKSSEISVTTTVLGECEHGKVLRSGARPGDRVAIAGRVGMAGAGLAILESKIQESTWSRSIRRLVAAQCRPEPPLESGVRAAQAGASSMLDVSDGLLRDLFRLAKSSAVNMALDSAALSSFAQRLEPASSLLNADPLSWVLLGGEDFSLLATFPEGMDIPEEFTVIGRVQALSSRRPTVLIDGKPMNESQGFDHFAKSTD